MGISQADIDEMKAIAREAGFGVDNAKTDAIRDAIAATAAAQAGDMERIIVEGQEVMIEANASEGERRNAQARLGSFADTVFPTEAAQNEQDLRNAASRERVEEKDTAFRNESAEVTSGRIQRFTDKNVTGEGVGPKGRKKNDPYGPFHLAAKAMEWAQPISLNLGGRNVNMTLGDVRDVASDRYNHYAKQLRQLKAQGASDETIKQARDNMQAYQQLMDITDDVASGKASPDAINQHLAVKGIDQDFAQNLPDHVKEANDLSVAKTAAENAGAHAGKSALQQMDSMMDEITPATPSDAATHGSDAEATKVAQPDANDIASLIPGLKFQ